MDPDQVKAARNRVAATKTENETVTLAGVFRGVLSDSREFDFIPDGQPLISGALAEAVTESEAEAMVPQALADAQKAMVGSFGLIRL